MNCVCGNFKPRITTNFARRIRTCVNCGRTAPSDELTPIEENSRQYKISNIGNILHNMSCSMDDENEQNEFGGHASFLWDLADYFRDSAVSSAEPSKPVYTQEMSDNGILPRVDMECMIKHTNWNNYIKVSILEVTDHYLIAKESSSNWEQHWDLKDISFKHIDTPTDEEKAIDDIRKIDQSIHENINFEQDFLNEIKAGKIHNVTWGK